MCYDRGAETDAAAGKAVFINTKAQDPSGTGQAISKWLGIGQTRASRENYVISKARETISE